MGQEVALPGFPGNHLGKLAGRHFVNWFQVLELGVSVDRIGEGGLCPLSVQAARLAADGVRATREQGLKSLEWS